MAEWVHHDVKVSGCNKEAPLGMCFRRSWQTRQNSAVEHETAGSRTEDGLTSQTPGDSHNAGRTECDLDTPLTKPLA